MNKVTAIYYLDYPDCEPQDCTNAHSRVHVEVGDENSTLNNFHFTYAFEAITYKYLEENFSITGEPLLLESVLLCPTIESVWIRKYMEENIDEIYRLAEQSESSISSVTITAEQYYALS